MYLWFRFHLTLFLLRLLSAGAGSVQTYYAGSWAAFSEEEVRGAVLMPLDSPSELWVLVNFFKEVWHLHSPGNTRSQTKVGHTRIREVALSLLPRSPDKGAVDSGLLEVVVPKIVAQLVVTSVLNQRSFSRFLRKLHNRKKSIRHSKKKEEGRKKKAERERKKERKKKKKRRATSVATRGKSEPSWRTTVNRCLT